MTNPFKKAPVATLMTASTALLAVLVYLQGTGLITGKAAVYVGVVAGALQVLLGLYARMHATPVADPHDNLGRALVPAVPQKAETSYRRGQFPPPSAFPPSAPPPGSL